VAYDCDTVRSRGQAERASSILSELQRRFPTSHEAVLSHVSLGKLLLGRGSAQAALEQFSLYLGTGGPLGEEALLGRAQALRALGRWSEEQATWQTLLARFPNSAYGAQARERIESLTHGQVR
jgi:TolA-binding protein